MSSRAITVYIAAAFQRHGARTKLTDRVRLEEEGFAVYLPQETQAFSYDALDRGENKSRGAERDLF